MKPQGKSAAILTAAGALYLRQGLRSTSMEAIAAAAGIAKPTLYAYFPDKAAILVALAEELIVARRAEFFGALADDGHLATRVAAALTARGKETMRLEQASPHVSDLYGPTSPIVGRLMREHDYDIAARLERELAEAGIERARLLAQLLLAASGGISSKATSPAELGPALRLLCDRLIRPELPG